MRRALATLAILAASGGLGAAGCGAAPRSAAGGTLPASVVDPYLRIHQELAVDAFDNVRQNAGEIATARRLSASDTCCGVVTMIAPATGTVWLRLSATSPVPGGRSTTR